MTPEERVIRDWLAGMVNPATDAPLPPSRRLSQPIPRKQVTAVVQTLVNLLDEARPVRAEEGDEPRPEWTCDWTPDDLNPGPECPYCAGDMCARIDGLNCTHNRVERHIGEEPRPDPRVTERPDEEGWHYDANGEPQPGPAEEPRALQPDLRDMDFALARAIGWPDTLLDIGTDHEGCTLRVLRSDDDPELGPGSWVLACETHDESNALLDFTALRVRATPVPASGLPSRDALAKALDRLARANRNYSPLFDSDDVRAADELNDAIDHADAILATLAGEAPR